MSVRDYQDFTNIDTPKEERRKLYVGDIYSNSAVCLKCGEVIRSKNRHDFVTCSCGNVSVDGGSWYVRRCYRDGEDSYREENVLYSDVKVDENGEII